jgi:hypothetical protein
LNLIDGLDRVLTLFLYRSRTRQIDETPTRLVSVPSGLIVYWCGPSCPLRIQPASASVPMAAAAAGFTPATARKALFTTTVTLLSSSLSRRASSIRSRNLSCSAAFTAATRLAPQPPDLVRWVQREGGFVHRALRVANHPEHGLGISASSAAAYGDIPIGDVLIALPSQLPLRLRRPTSAADDVLVQLAQQVPGNVLSD